MRPYGLASSPRCRRRAVVAVHHLPTVAVLPLTNLSEDPEQGYFAEGVAEEIITALSRSSVLALIARNSSFAYKGQAIDERRVGRELGAGYVAGLGAASSGSLRWSTHGSAGPKASRTPAQVASER